MGAAAGGYIEHTFAAHEIVAVTSVTVGAGGAGGVNGHGFAGGISSFGTHLTAFGAPGGLRAVATGGPSTGSNSIPSVGGGASGPVGSIIIAGTPETYGAIFQPTASTWHAAYGGAGGRSYLSPGGRAVSASNEGSGAPGFGGGAGGGAIAQNHGAVNGAAGAQGIIIIEEYYA